MTSNITRKMNLTLVKLVVIKTDNVEIEKILQDNKKEKCRTRLFRGICTSICVHA